MSSPTEKLNVLFQGHKTFWKTSTYLNVTIVHHVDLSCMETIIYNPSIDVEYPRIYMNTDLINTKFDKDQINSKYLEIKEKLTRQKKTVDHTSVIHDITM